MGPTKKSVEYGSEMDRPLLGCRPKPALAPGWDP